MPYATPPARLAGNMAAPWVVLLALFLPETALGATRRLAVFVGHNSGNELRKPLRFAESDAAKLAATMVEVGGLSADDAILLQGQPIRAVNEALAVAAVRVAQFQRQPDTRVFFTFYFSGHSDGEALELGGERLLLRDLRRLLEETGADVRLLIVDACKSGAAIAPKGATAVPPFELHITDQLNQRGEVMLTSSAADENSLESNEIMGGYFTHHLVSGLRGAADLNGDDLVSCTELYSYTHQHTVASSTATLHGAQTPEFKFDYSGQGELILSFLNQGQARVTLPSGFTRAFVTHVRRDHVLTELSSDAPRTVVLAPGLYAIRLLRAKRLFGARFTLANNETRNLGWSEFKPIEGSALVLVKGASGIELEATPATRTDGFGLVASGGMGMGVAQQLGIVATGRLVFETGWPRGFVAGAAIRIGSGAQGQLLEYWVAGRFGYQFGWAWEGVGVAGGIEIAVGAAGQDVQGVGSSVTFAASAVPRVLGRVRLADSLYLLCEVEGEVALLGVIDGNVGARLLPSANMGLAWSF